MKPAPHPPENVARALDLARAGKTDPEIASALCVAKSTVCGWRRKANIPAVPKKLRIFAVGERVGGVEILDVLAVTHITQTTRYRVQMLCCGAVCEMSHRQIVNRVRYESTWCRQCVVRGDEPPKRRTPAQAPTLALSIAQVMAMSGRWV